MKEVRLQGLMGGVELARPTTGLRWGRRVSARRRPSAACCCGPLGDIVVLMPPLTITSPEIHRIVDALADAIDEVTDAMTWREWADDDARRDPRRRTLACAARPRRTRARGHARPVTDRVVSFASNDYLGLTQHPARRRGRARRARPLGRGLRARPGSIVGSRPVHTELEARARAMEAMPRAALFPTGFAANLGVLTTFGGPGVLVCSDELNHASIIDGCRLSRADVAIYRHRDLDHLDALLRGTRRRARAIVVSDTVFSMDGDAADVDALVDSPARHDALLVLDEAHAVLGPAPRRSRTTPTCCASARCRRRSARSAGSSPGRRATSSSSRTRPGRTSSRPRRRRPTPPPRSPRCESCESPEGDALVARLRGHVDRLRPGHPSPILPFVCGDETRALDAAAALLEHGLLVPAIRPPTVAPGTSRLRVALSAAHTDEQRRPCSQPRSPSVFGTRVQPDA